MTEFNDMINQLFQEADPNVKKLQEAIQQDPESWKKHVEENAADMKLGMELSHRLDAIFLEMANIVEGPSTTSSKLMLERLNEFTTKELAQLIKHLEWRKSCYLMSQEALVGCLMMKLDKEE